MPRHFVALIFIFLFTNILTLVILNSLPLPHLYNPHDYFMDFWNVAHAFANYELYKTGGFYNPAGLLPVLFLDDYFLFNAMTARNMSMGVTSFLIFILFSGSTLNYLAIRRNKIDSGALLLCFLSSPIILTCSRLNTILIPYFILSLIFYFGFDRKYSKRVGHAYWAVFCFFKSYFLIFPMFLD